MKCRQRLDTEEEEEAVAGTNWPHHCLSALIVQSVFGFALLCLVVCFGSM